jgi:hypothetical protein
MHTAFRSFWDCSMTYDYVVAPDRDVLWSLVLEVCRPPHMSQAPFVSSMWNRIPRRHELKSWLLKQRHATFLSGASPSRDRIAINIYACLHSTPAIACMIKGRGFGWLKRPVIYWVQLSPSRVISSTIFPRTFANRLRLLWTCSYLPFQFVLGSLTASQPATMSCAIPGTSSNPSMVIFRIHLFVLLPTLSCRWRFFDQEHISLKSHFVKQSVFLLTVFVNPRGWCLFFQLCKILFFSSWPTNVEGRQYVVPRWKAKCRSSLPWQPRTVRVVYGQCGLVKWSIA